MEGQFPKCQIQNKKDLPFAKKTFWIIIAIWKHHLMTIQIFLSPPLK